MLVVHASWSVQYPQWYRGSQCPGEIMCAGCLHQPRSPQLDQWTHAEQVGAANDALASRLQSDVNVGVIADLFRWPCEPRIAFHAHHPL